MMHDGFALGKAIGIFAINQGGNGIGDLGKAVAAGEKEWLIPAIAMLMRDTVDTAAGSIGAEV